MLKQDGRNVQLSRENFFYLSRGGMVPQKLGVRSQLNKNVTVTVTFLLRSQVSPDLYPTPAGGTPKEMHSGVPPVSQNSYPDEK